MQTPVLGQQGIRVHIDAVDLRARAMGNQQNRIRKTLNLHVRVFVKERARVELKTMIRGARLDANLIGIELLRRVGNRRDLSRVPPAALEAAIIGDVSKQIIVESMVQR